MKRFPYFFTNKKYKLRLVFYPSDWQEIKRLILSSVDGDRRKQGFQSIARNVVGSAFLEIHLVVSLQCNFSVAW